jgi:hypothetical protein
MPKPVALISAEWSQDIVAPEFGRRFIESLCAEPRLVPEQLGLSEQFTDPFRGTDEFVANWWAMDAESWVEGGPKFEFHHGPEWRRRSALASQGRIHHGIVDIKNQRSPSRISFHARWDRRCDFDRLFREWLALGPADIGMLHLYTEPEQGRPTTEAQSWFQTGNFGGPMKPGLPNIGWAMAYGKAYESEVDVARIRAAGFSVEQQDGVSVVRVTENLSDVVDDFEQFSRRRAELKSLFRPDLFWITEEPPRKAR